MDKARHFGSKARQSVEIRDHELDKNEFFAISQVMFIIELV